jgi:hypothetical protein
LAKAALAKPPSLVDLMCDNPDVHDAVLRSFLDFD